MIPTKPQNVTWTDEQWQAIYEDKKNIIVSAGAGSGKTAVLTERVIRKLKDGVHINELLILTFTKAASAEMADRIRKKINKIPELQAELNLIDAAYITTFDSFALSIVKKYHYLLNISNNIKIIDSNVILMKKKDILENLFLEKYASGDQKFLKLIQDFCLKDDSNIREYILNINSKLDLLSNKEEYLTNYLNNNFSEIIINKNIAEYLELLKSKLTLIQLKIKEISYIDNEYASKLNSCLEEIFNASSYDEIKERTNIKLPAVPRGCDLELKNLKQTITNTVKEIKLLTGYSDSKEIYNTIISTKDTVEVIIKIILEFSKRIMNYKKANNVYEFNDIAIMSINILKRNPNIREELLETFNEIMIDEYQDTNDLQEEFISMISKNNVYMVGDIKQSIYRFRNANPLIFKNKYENYSISDKDIKIDLNKNFRSREEVLDNINIMFNLIMDQEIGGADYIKEHQMIFGNGAYLKEKINHSNDMNIYSYDYEKEIGYSKEEIEAFIIAKDILNKKENNYQVFDKDSGLLRKASYQDFAIIIDRATSFGLYKKIFSYLGIPLELLKDETMNDSADLNVIKNVIKLIISIKENVFDKNFKYLFTSVARSFLYNLPDDVIFNYFEKNNFKESIIYQTCYTISKKIDYLTINELLNLIEKEFDYYKKLVTIGDINNCIIKMEKIKSIAQSLEEMGYTIEDFVEYLENIIKEGYTMDYKSSRNSTDSVKIMTIHKSKGLEYPICYFSGLYKTFNISDLNEKFIFDKKYGIIVPYFNNGIGETIYKPLLKNKYLEEEISEKIRLFYVALTRAREKIILVHPNYDIQDNNYRYTILPNTIKQNYRSFLDMLSSIDFIIKKYESKIDLEKTGLTHNYNLIKQENYKEKISSNTSLLNINEINISNENISDKSFSKKVNKLITKAEYESMNLGTKLHEILELVDLKSPDYSKMPDKLSEKILKSFLSKPELSNINKAKIYKENEFIYKDKDTIYHGIIDLILEYEDHIDIIDYKLKNISDLNYLSQLHGYKNYVIKRTNKLVNLYLYSLLDTKLTKI